MTVEKRGSAGEAQQAPYGGVDDDGHGGDYYPVLRLWK
jgi:hypothetical protein